MSIFTFNCKYDTIEAFLADKSYSSFIMKQGWFQSHKHAECRNQIAKYKEDSKKLVDDEMITIREKLYPKTKSIFTFNCKYDTIEAFLADRKYSSYIMKQGWFTDDKHEEFRKSIKSFKVSKMKEKNEVIRLAAQLYMEYEPHHYAQWDKQEGHSAMYERKKMNDIFETMAKQKLYFKRSVDEELIAEALHPRRIQAQMNHFDDIEAYFEAMC